MTNDDLVNLAGIITFKDGGSIVKGKDGFWYNFTHDSLSFKTAIEAYEDMIKFKTETECQQKSTT
jgi:hypothetical protein